MDFEALQAVQAVAAAVDLVAPADAIAYFQMSGAWANGFDNADSFVAEGHVCVALVLLVREFKIRVVGSYAV
jgi:hypothetical protein